MDNQGKLIAGKSSSCAGSSSSSRNPLRLVSGLESSVVDVLSGGFMIDREEEQLELSTKELTESDELGKEESKKLEKFFAPRNKQETGKIEDRPVDEDRVLVEEDFSMKDFQGEELLEAKVSKTDEDGLVMMKGDEAKEPERARWNLRPRKPIQRPKVPKPCEVVKSSPDVGGKSIDKRKLPKATKKGKATDDRNEEEKDNNAKAKDKGKKKGDYMPIMPNFSLTLTKEEIEADFIAMTGQKPPRKLKKRNKTVQRTLDHLFPGMHLDSITPNDYRVPDQNPKKGE